MIALVLEDDQANINYIEYLLYKLGFETVSAKTGEDALELLKNQNVHCMLIDIALEEGMSGIEFLKKVIDSDVFGDVPKIAITAYTSLWQKEGILNEGFDDFLAKPIKIEELKKVLQRNLLIHIKL